MEIRLKLCVQGWNSQFQPRRPFCATWPPIEPLRGTRAIFLITLFRRLRSDNRHFVSNSNSAAPHIKIGYDVCRSYADRDKTWQFALVVRARGAHA